METQENTETLYLITVGDLQDYAVGRINRILNADELRIAKKCVEHGLSEIIDITLRSAIEQAVEKN